MAASVGLVMGTGWLAACGKGEHKPIDTAKVFDVKSTFSDGYKTKTTGPKDIDPKMLGPQKLPPGVKFDPSDCGDYVVSGRLPKGIRGKMSVFSADGDGNRFVVIAVQADKDMPFDAAEAKKCKDVTFEAGKITGTVQEVDAPQIKGAETVGSRREISVDTDEGQHSREVYNYTAYLGDWMVLVTANPLVVKGQPSPPVNADRASQLLVDSVSVLRK